MNSCSLVFLGTLSHEVDYLRSCYAQLGDAGRMYCSDPVGTASAAEIRHNTWCLTCKILIRFHTSMQQFYYIISTLNASLGPHCLERPPVLKDQVFLTEGPTFNVIVPVTACNLL